MSEATDWKRTAAERLLGWPDTAVIEDAAQLLTLSAPRTRWRSSARRSQPRRAAASSRSKETILHILSASWKSGAVDVPALLGAVSKINSEQARRGASLALGWLSPEA